MKLIDILSLFDENACLNVYSAVTLELLTSYDGRDNIPKKYHGAPVKKISCDAIQGAVSVYIGFVKIGGRENG